MYSQKRFVHFFKLIENGEKLFTDNFTMSKIQGKDKFILKMNFRNNLTLNNALYVLEICKNLVYRSLLNKHGFCLVFEYYKIIFF